MCRTHRNSRPPPQHPNMAPAQNNVRDNYSYADRLDNLKRVLKPYRDNNANCLRLITRSARVNLNKHWKSLENLFVVDRDGHRKERAQNAKNEKLLREDRENADPTSDAAEKLQHLHVDR